MPTPPRRPDLSEDQLRRIRITTGCGDCRDIPKTPGAGCSFDGPDGRYQLMHNGVRIVEHCYCGPWMTELIRRLEGHHEPQEERAFYELLPHVPAGGVMVELGAWWGYYSLWFHARVPRARVHLVEPDRRNLEVGRRNFALNRAQGNFHWGGVGRSSRPLAPFRCDDGLETSVPVLTLDDFLERERIERLELLLADIQGAELEMLEGARRSLDAGKIRFLVLSTHHHAISGDPLTHQKCLAFLRERNARLLAEHGVWESFSGDGLIVASFDPRDARLPTIALSYNRSSDNLFRELEYDLADSWAALRAASAPSTAAVAERRRPWYRRLFGR